MSNQNTNGPAGTGPNDGSDGSSRDDQSATRIALAASAFYDGPDRSYRTEALYLRRIGRAVVLHQVSPDAFQTLTPRVLDGLSRQHQVAITGLCECGATFTPSGDVTRSLYQIMHADDCPASEDIAAELERWAGSVDLGDMRITFTTDDEHPDGGGE